MELIQHESPNWLRYFNRFRTRTQSYLDMDGAIDERVLPICKDVQRWSNAWTTVFSCEGHPYGYDNCGQEQPGPDAGYLLFTTKCRHSLQHLQSVLVQTTVNMLKTGLDESMAPTIELTPMRGCSEILMPDEEWYRAVGARTPKFVNNTIRDKWWTLFHESFTAAYDKIYL